jgi:hypothetical protein
MGSRHVGAFRGLLQAPANIQLIQLGGRSGDRRQGSGTSGYSKLIGQASLVLLGHCRMFLHAPPVTTANRLLISSIASVGKYTCSEMAGTERPREGQQGATPYKLTVN